MGLNKKLVQKQRARRIVADLPDPPATPTQTAVPDATDDEQNRLDLASRWLFGYTKPEKSIAFAIGSERVQRDGLLVRKRPPTKNERENGPTDSECRVALAQLIWRGDLPPEFRWRLASIIAPDGHELADDDTVLNFASRSRGKVQGEKSRGSLSSAGRGLQMALFVRTALGAGHSRTDAIAAASERYDVSVRTIETAWATHKNSLSDRATEAK